MAHLRFRQRLYTESMINKLNLFIVCFNVNGKLIFLLAFLFEKKFAG
jgi:hypothetical protein